MTKGIPIPRDARLANATKEGKRAYFQTRSWEKTRYHVIGWLAVTYALSQGTARDYANVVELRLRSDPDVMALVSRAEKPVIPKANFTVASNL